MANATARDRQYVAPCGERGVGKTSLANVLAEVFVSDSRDPKVRQAPYLVFEQNRLTVPMPWPAADLTSRKQPSQ